MKKAKRGIAGLLSMALVLGCLGSLPASAENTSSCISTIDENGVIHTKIGAETNITLATYAPDYKDIREEKPEYSEWIISIPTSDNDEAVKDYCEKQGYYISPLQYNIDSDTRVLMVNGYLQGDTHIEFTKEECESTAADILQKKLAEEVTIGTFCSAVSYDMIKTSGTVAVYADKNLTEDDFAWLDTSTATLEIEGNVGRITQHDLPLTAEEQWKIQYQLLLNALEKTDGATGVWYSPYMYNLLAQFHVHDPKTYTVHPTGDIDNNETVDTSDIFDVMYYVARKGAGIEDVSFTDGNAVEEAAVFAAADIDGNGKLDSTDVYYMMKYCAEKGAGLNPSWGD